ncbi:MAG: DUF459 domain-containing protein [Ilumatobacteraceae bacterium]
MSGPKPGRRSGRRASRRTYMLRRVVALGIVGLIVFGAVRAVGSLTSGDDPIADAEGPTTSEPATDQITTDPATVPSTSVDSVATSVPADTTPAATGPATVDDPAKVYIVGDSDAGTFGPYLQSLLDSTNIVETELNYKVSSGLARPDFFDWPAELEAKLPAAAPDIVVATFGGNDSQGLAVADGTFIVSDPVSDEADWTEEYRRRVGEVMDLMGANGATVVWVGIPNDDNPDVTARLRIQDQAVRAEAAERDNVVFIDTWARFSGRDGNWAEFVIDPRDSQGKDVRADDGFHLNTNGAEILALDIAQAIRDELRARGAAI